MKKSTLLLSTSIGLTIAVAMGTTGFAAAAKHKTSVANVVHARIQTASQGKLKGSVASSGYYGATSTTSATQLDSESVQCKGKSTCTLEMSVMVQQCGFDGEFSANDYAIQVTVDGNYVDGGPYAGGTQTAHVCDIDNWQGAYSVSSGSHTVAVFAYESSAAYLAQWSDRTDVGVLK